MSNLLLLGLGKANAGEPDSPGTPVQRFYFGNETAAAVAPAFGAGWGYTDVATRKALLAAKDVSETIGNIHLTIESNPALAFQYVSAPLVAQMLTGTIKSQQLARVEFGSNSYARLGIFVVSGDGSVIRGQLLPIADYSTGTSFFSHSTTVRNKTFANGDSLIPLAVLDGDRLVVEVGTDAGDVGIQVSLRTGAPTAGADLLETETGNSGTGWIEFSNPILLA